MLAFMTPDSSFIPESPPNDRRTKSPRALVNNLYPRLQSTPSNLPNNVPNHLCAPRARRK